MSEKLYNATEVALMLDMSVPTLGNWYKFKRCNPDNEFAQQLPDPIQSGPRQKRYWTQTDVEKLIKFKNSIVWGRNGFMGAMTKSYGKGRKENQHEMA